MQYMDIYVLTTMAWFVRFKHMNQCKTALNGAVKRAYIPLRQPMLEWHESIGLCLTRI